jgi:hypothetical protein
MILCQHAASVDIERGLQCLEKRSSDRSGGSAACCTVMFAFRFVTPEDRLLSLLSEGT